MEWTIILSNGQEVQAFLDRLQRAMADDRGTLMRSLGDVFVQDVRQRILTSDGNRWRPASKWLRAKTGQSKVLLGAERYVKARVTAKQLKIVGTSSHYALSKHHEGFSNDLVGKGELVDSYGRITLKIKDPRPLNLYMEMRRVRRPNKDAVGPYGYSTPKATVFKFKPVNAGYTPARKIWTDPADVPGKAGPVVSRWLQKVVKDAGGRLMV